VVSDGGPAWAGAVAVRSDEIVACLAVPSIEELLAPSLLPEWDRLTVVCHLRYGAEALCRMTDDAMAGRPTAYYPSGRDRARPFTLQPLDGETPKAAVESLDFWCAELTARWSSLVADQWDTMVEEPAGQVDLGSLPLSRLALLRLSEVEVHGTDLGLGLREWSEVFVRSSLAFRLEWLNSRRVNHVAFDGAVQGSWLLVAADGPTYRVVVVGDSVTSMPAERTESAEGVIAGTSRDLLALMLGRPTIQPLEFSGDIDLAHAFSAAFPGP
jgi:hypothetical protein